MDKVEKRILVLTYWAYQDALIQSYTLPYLKIMAENSQLSIWLVCLQPANKRIQEKERIAIQNTLSQFRIQLITCEYKPLSLIGVINTGFIFCKLFYLTLKLKISVIHAWATPAGALGYLIAKPLSKKLVIDSYEPHAEAMVENGTWKSKGFAFRLLFWLEKKQTHYADTVIAAAEGMREYARIKYGKNFYINFFVKPACVDFELFNYHNKDSELRESMGLKDKIVGVYAGKFGGIYLDKEFFRWLKIAVKHWGDRFRLLLLTSHSKEEILKFCNQANVSSDIIIQKFVPHKEVPLYMGLADFALTPVKPVPSKRYCTPVKDGEYWAMGLPVIIPQGISDDSAIINEQSIGYVLEELNEDEYLKSIKVIEKLTADPQLSHKIIKVAERYRSFEIARKVYHYVYSD
jgi:glycosyltransferase involved in cell wall biosynthesis